MPATPEEMQCLVSAFDKAHAPMMRAMADLLIRGNVILEEHRLLEGKVGDAFEAFVFARLAEHNISKQEFAQTRLHSSGCATPSIVSTSCRLDLQWPD